LIIRHLYRNRPYA